jgi:hypothetical protein
MRDTTRKSACDITRRLEARRQRYAAKNRLVVLQVIAERRVCELRHYRAPRTGRYYDL